MRSDQRTPGTPDQDVGGKLARLAELEATTSTLRHDLRGMLAPAFLVVDRLLAHSDPKVVRAGKTVVKAIERAEERLAATRAPAQEQRFGSDCSARPTNVGTLLDDGASPELSATRLSPPL